MVDDLCIGLFFIVIIILSIGIIIPGDPNMLELNLLAIGILHGLRLVGRSGGQEHERHSWTIGRHKAEGLPGLVSALLFVFRKILIFLLVNHIVALELLVVPVTPLGATSKLTHKRTVSHRVFSK